jgi:hypothetical protein
MEEHSQKFLLGVATHIGKFISKGLADPRQKTLYTKE